MAGISLYLGCSCEYSATASKQGQSFKIMGSTDHFLKFLYYTSFLTPHDPISYIHDVTPSVVPSAVRIEISTCTINFHVSFFILLYLLVSGFEACGATTVVATTVVTTGIVATASVGAATLALATTAAVA